MSHAISKQFEMLRGFTLTMINHLKEEQIDIVPDGFNNNIRWNIGHILVAQDYLLYGRDQAANIVKPGYVELFNQGTKPADWTGEVPSLATLAADLEAQMSRIEKDFGHRWDEKLPKPFILRPGTEMTTYGEVMIFTLYHEGWHVGYIQSLKRAMS